MIRHNLKSIIACALAWSLACCAAARAQHIDVLTQQVAGRLVTGSANFDTNQWTLGRRVYSSEFDEDYAVNSPGFNALATGSPSLPPGSQSLPGNSPLGWDFLSLTIEQQSANLFYWNGLESDGQAGITPGDVAFGALPGPNYALSLFDRTNAKFTVDGADQNVTGGVIDETAANGSLHRHRFFLLEDGDGSGATQPADGIYLFAMQLRMPGLDGADPIFMVFGTPGSSVAALDSAAVPWVEQRVGELAAKKLPGDYNRDGSVDAADYVVWRKTLGQIGPDLAADGDGNHEVDPEDYTIWKANFGALATPVGGNVSSLPEPATWKVLFAATAIVVLADRRVRISPSFSSCRAALG